MENNNFNKQQSQQAPQQPQMYYQPQPMQIPYGYPSGNYMNQPQYQQPYPQQYYVQPQAQPQQPREPRYPKNTYKSLSKEEKKKIFKSTYIDYTWVSLWLVLFTVITQGCAVLFATIFKNTSITNDYIVFALLGTFVCMHLVATPATFFGSKIRRTQAPEPHRIGAGMMSITYLFTLFCAFSGAIIGSILMMIIGNNNSQQEVSQLATGGSFFLRLLVVCISAPIIEELIFRKMIIDHLYKHGELAAILFSGIAFGAYHGNFAQFFLATFIGISNAYIYTRTGKIRYPIILHMGVNLLTTVGTAQIYATGNMGLIGIWAMLIFGAWIAGLVLFIVILCRKIHFKLHINQNFASTLVPMFANVFTILFFAYCVYQFVVSLS